MKKVITDTLVSSGVGAAGYAGVTGLESPHPDPIAHTLQIIITIASVLGSLWTPIKGVIGLFKKQPQ